MGKSHDESDMIYESRAQIYWWQLWWTTSWDCHCYHLKPWLQYLAFALDNPFERLHLAPSTCFGGDKSARKGGKRNQFIHVIHSCRQTCETFIVLCLWHETYDTFPCLWHDTTQLTNLRVWHETWYTGDKLGIMPHLDFVFYSVVQWNSMDWFKGKS